MVLSIPSPPHTAVMRLRHRPRDWYGEEERSQLLLLPTQEEENRSFDCSETTTIVVWLLQRTTTPLPLPSPASDYRSRLAIDEWPCLYDDHRNQSESEQEEQDQEQKPRPEFLWHEEPLVNSLWEDATHDTNKVVILHTPLELPSPWTESESGMNECSVKPVDQFEWETPEEVFLPFHIKKRLEMELPLVDSLLEQATLIHHSLIVMAHLEPLELPECPRMPLDKPFVPDRIMVSPSPSLDFMNLLLVEENEEKEEKEEDGSTRLQTLEEPLMEAPSLPMRRFECPLLPIPHVCPSSLRTGINDGGILSPDLVLECDHLFSVSMPRLQEWWRSPSSTYTTLVLRQHVHPFCLTRVELQLPPVWEMTSDALEAPLRPLIEDRTTESESEVDWLTAAAEAVDTNDILSTEERIEEYVRLRGIATRPTRLEANPPSTPYRKVETIPGAISLLHAHLKEKAKTRMVWTATSRDALSHAYTLCVGHLASRASIRFVHTQIELRTYWNDESVMLFVDASLLEAQWMEEEEMSRDFWSSISVVILSEVTASDRWWHSFVSLCVTASIIAIPAHWNEDRSKICELLTSIEATGVQRTSSVEVPLSSTACDLIQELEVHGTHILQRTFKEAESVALGSIDLRVLEELIHQAEQDILVESSMETCIYYEDLVKLHILAHLRQCVLSGGLTTACAMVNCVRRNSQVMELLRGWIDTLFHSITQLAHDEGTPHQIWCKVSELISEDFTRAHGARANSKSLVIVEWDVVIPSVIQSVHERVPNVHVIRDALHELPPSWDTCLILSRCALNDKRYADFLRQQIWSLVICCHPLHPCPIIFSCGRQIIIHATTIYEQEGQVPQPPSLSPLVIFVSDRILQDHSFLTLLSREHNFALIERQLAFPVSLLIDESSCVCVESVSVLLSETSEGSEACVVFVDEITLISLSYTRIVILLEATNEDERDSLFRHQSRLHKMISLCNMTHCDISIRFSFSSCETAHHIARAAHFFCEERNSHWKSKEQWRSREWLVEEETTHERFLAGFPSLNAFTAQMMLTLLQGGLPVILAMSEDELVSQLPWIPTRCLEVLHRMIHTMNPFQWTVPSLSSYPGRRRTMGMISAEPAREEDPKACPSDLRHRHLMYTQAPHSNQARLIWKD